MGNAGELDEIISYRDLRVMLKPVRRYWMVLRRDK